MHAAQDGLLASRSGVPGYDAARWTAWVPRLTHVHAAGGLRSLQQAAPEHAAGSNETHVPPNDSHVLLLFTKGAPNLDGRIAGRPMRVSLKPWEAIFLPAGIDSWWASTPRSVDGVFHLHLDHYYLKSFASESEVGRKDLVPRIGFRDEFLNGLVGMAMNDLSAPATPARLVWDAYASALALRLLRMNEVAARPPSRCVGLAPWQLRRVTEFMREHAHHDLMLEDLARLVDLSASHFARAFRQSTGLPPHRWLVNQRVERAQDLLSQGNLTIAEIALTCGFADQSHFTSMFHKVTGVTPGAYRREKKS